MFYKITNNERVAYGVELVDCLVPCSQTHFASSDSASAIIRRPQAPPPSGSWHGNLIDS